MLLQKELKMIFNVSNDVGDSDDCNNDDECDDAYWLSRLQSGTIPPVWMSIYRFMYIYVRERKNDSL